jgi:hypothetical protein
VPLALPNTVRQFYQIAAFGRSECRAGWSSRRVGVVEDGGA